MIEFHFVRLNTTVTRKTLFQKIQTMSMPCSLDTSNEVHRCAQWNLLTANPLFTLTTRTETEPSHSNQSVHFWNLLKNRLQDIQREIQASELLNSDAYRQYETFWHTHYPAPSQTYIDHKPPLPGFLGFISYQFNAPPPQKDSIDRVSINNRTAPQVPNALIGYYPWIIVFDCHNAPYLVSLLHESDTQKIKQTLEAESVTHSHETNNHFRLVTPLAPDTPTPLYQKAVDALLHHIHQGDCYQVNLAQRFSATFEGQPAVAYQKLMAQSQTPFSVFFRWEYQNRTQCLLSMSPERFLASDTHHIATFPIKGTAKRHRDDALKDKNQAEQLIHSEKNRAENLMIVDLMRNDLSQIADHIKVPVLFGLKTFQSVFHLESIITGTYRTPYNHINVPSTLDTVSVLDTLNAIDALHTCFPAGSITGAPKKMAMALIEQYEWHPRTLYCGTFIHLDVQGHLNSNILIRSLLTEDNQLYLWSGGGIVADSEVQQEYQETLDKIHLMTETLTKPCEF